MPNDKLQQFGYCLSQYEWSSILNAENVDGKVEVFTRVTNDMINHYFPEKTARMHCDDKFFITAKIKECLSSKNCEKEYTGNPEGKEDVLHQTFQGNPTRKSYWSNSVYHSY